MKQCCLSIICICAADAELNCWAIRLKVATGFPTAIDTGEFFLDLLRKVGNQPFSITTAFFLENVKSEPFKHVFKVFLERFRFVIREQTASQGIYCLDLLGF